MIRTAEPYRAKPYILDRDTAPAFWLVATLWMPMATGAQTGNHFSLIEQLMPQGLGPPTHYHPDADEGFYVLEGLCAFNAGGQTHRAGKGTFIHLPRMTPHSFSVESEEARVINFYAPAGFELVVMSCGRPADERRRPSIQESLPPSADQVRILSSLFGQVAVRALPFTEPSTDAMMTTEPPAWSPSSLHISAPDTAPAFQALEVEWRLLAASSDTGGTYDLFQVKMSASGSLELHISAQDEAIYVLEGGLELRLNGESHNLGEGCFGYVPAGAGSAWRPGSEGACLLVFLLPGGFDAAVTRYGGSGDLPGDDGKVRQYSQAMGAVTGARTAGMTIREARSFYKVGDER